MTSAPPWDLSEVTRRLTAAGCVAAAEEARELAQSASGDRELFDAMVERRTAGEPLAWVTGWVTFCGCPVAVTAGVYVPRWQSEPLAERAAELLPPFGRAVDLGTGSGAIACVLRSRRPGASIIGTEVDPSAAQCARCNLVDVVEGDLFEGVPDSWRGTVDVIVGVLPYVPTGEMARLPRDVRDFEPATALDGGGDGLTVIRRALGQSRRWLNDEGHLLFEIGGDQPEVVTAELESAGFDVTRIMYDDDGDPRAIEATVRSGSP